MKPAPARAISNKENVMDTLYIVVPAYNESENIRQLVEDWYPVVEAHSEGGTSRLVVINDGSKDDTYEILKELAKTRPLLQPLTKPNGGHGPTLIYGYKYAIEHGATYVFQTDSDGQTLPAEFEDFWKLRKGYSAIFGKRTVRQDGKNRKFVENSLCKLLRLFFKVKVPDSNAPFRLMRRSFLTRYLPLFEDDYNLPNVMLTVCAAYYKEKYTFREITFRPRQGGDNSINAKKIIKIGTKSLKDFRRYRKKLKEYNPNKK